MKLCRWECLPEEMKTNETRKYYDILKKKEMSLFCTRVFDIIVSFIMLVILAPLFLIIAVAIKIDSKGSVFYRQVRVTQYGRHFKIHKFRSMVIGADNGSQVTVNNDSRVTKVGHIIRKCRLDEISQLIDVLQGNMTFVGTRPEVPKYVEKYTPEMMATLLLPAGVTSLASIYYKDEAALLNITNNIDDIYINCILPEKMKYNLKSLQEYNCINVIILMLKTFFAVCGANYKNDTKNNSSDGKMALTNIADPQKGVGGK